MAKLLLVRHGQTEWNATGRYQGQRDTHLSETGIKQAEALRDRLRHEKIARVYSSDLERARKTAEIVNSPHGLPIKTTPSLRELSFGKFEGLTFPEIRERFPEETRRWLSDRVSVRPPGGENLLDIAQRVQAKFAEIISENNAETALVVAHGGPIRVILCHLLHVDVKYFIQFHVDNAALCIVDTYPEGSVLALHNDTSHLKGL